MITWIAPAAALLAGFLLGWAIRAGRDTSDSRQDWKTRLAARDTDVREAQDRLADATVELQAAQEQLAARGDPMDAPEVRERIAALEERLTAEGCPDPAAHGAAASLDPPNDLDNVVSLRSGGAPAGGQPVDDLTRIPGIDEGVEMVLAGMGVTSYRQLMQLSEEQTTIVEDLLHGTIVDRIAWSQAARELHEDKYGEAI